MSMVITIANLPNNDGIVINGFGEPIFVKDLSEAFGKIEKRFKENSKNTNCTCSDCKEEENNNLKASSNIPEQELKNNTKLEKVELNIKVDRNTHENAIKLLNELGNKDLDWDRFYNDAAIVFTMELKQKADFIINKKLSNDFSFLEQFKKELGLFK